jgi:SAM-dependent methyltransferase
MSDLSSQTLSPHFAEDATARTYREIHLPRVFAPWARILIEMVPTQSGESVLDVATGPGPVAREAARAAGPNGRVVGVDISAAMLAVARAWQAEQGAAPIEYLEASALSIPLPDASFDIAYCQQGLQHIADPLAALREMRRLLRSGGRVGVAAWIKSPFSLFREVVDRVAGPATGIQSSGFGRVAAELSAALESSGFADVVIKSRELTAVLEGGIPQALEVAKATSASVGMRNLSPAQRQVIEDAIAEELAPLTQNGKVQLRSISNIASARVHD